MAIKPQALASAFCISMLSSSCSSEEPCPPPYHRHEIYLYATPEATYLFFKNDPRPIGYTVTEDTEFWTEINQVFSSHVGKDIGVEASICGKIESVDLPLSSFAQSMSIREGIVLKLVDLTKLRETYLQQLGLPEPAVRPPSPKDK